MVRRRETKKLLVASVGVATVNYIAVACGQTETSRTLVGPQPQTTGSQSAASFVGNLVAPPDTGSSFTSASATVTASTSAGGATATATTATASATATSGGGTTAQGSTGQGGAGGAGDGGQAGASGAAGAPSGNRSGVGR